MEPNDLKYTNPDEFRNSTQADIEFASEKEEAAFKRRLDRSMRYLGRESSLNVSGPMSSAMSAAECGRTNEAAMTSHVKELSQRYPESTHIKRMEQAYEVKIEGDYAFFRGDTEGAVTAWAKCIRLEKAMWMNRFMFQLEKPLKDVYGDVSKPLQTRGDALLVDSFTHIDEATISIMHMQPGAEELTAMLTLSRYQRSLKQVKLAQLH